jgi:hypothetical protein
MKTALVMYPERRLGYRCALTPRESAYDTNVWGLVAIANLRPGDSFQLIRRQYLVASITEKTLTVIDEDGVRRSYRPDTPAFEQLVRDAGGELLAHLHRTNHVFGAPKSGLWDALVRDPAFRVRAGLWSLEDETEAVAA